MGGRAVTVTGDTAALVVSDVNCNKGGLRCCDRQKQACLHSSDICTEAACSFNGLQVKAWGQAGCMEAGGPEAAVFDVLHAAGLLLMGGVAEMEEGPAGVDPPLMSHVLSHQHSDALMLPAPHQA